MKFGASTRHFILHCEQGEKVDEIEKSSSEKTDAIFMKNSNHETSKNRDKKEGDDIKDDTPSLKDIYKGYLEKKYGSRNTTGTEAKIDGLIKTGGEEGIGWGIMDEDIVYRQQNEDEMSLEPELLRDLPDLTDKQREKIDKYEAKLEKYEPNALRL